MYVEDFDPVFGKRQKLATHLFNLRHEKKLF